jgi:hypothetical protein
LHDTVCLTQDFQNSCNFAFLAQFFVFGAIFFWNGFGCASHARPVALARVARHAAHQNKQEFVVLHKRVICNKITQFDMK